MTIALERVPSSASRSFGANKGPPIVADNSYSSAGAVHRTSSSDEETAAEIPRHNDAASFTHDSSNKTKEEVPADIEAIREKNDLTKTNEEKQREGEHDLQPREEDGKIVLTERAGYLSTGYSYPTWKKWAILCVIFAVQVSMNFNTSVYPNAVVGVAEKYRVSEPAARSKEIGRWPVLQLSLFLVNIWQILAALAPNYGSLIAARFLGGLFTAGGSVTLGMVADLWEPDEQQFAVAFVVLSSVGGTSVSPFVGGFIQAYLKLEWNFWIQLIFGGVVQIAHFFFVPETRSTILLDREAKRRRKSGENNIYGPNEVRTERFSMKEIGTYWLRPFESLLCFSSHCFLSFQLVYKQWGFSTVQIGLAFIPINLGYLLAYFIFVPRFRWERKRRVRDPDALAPEARLWLLHCLAPLEALGLFGFAWTSLGPPQVHWIAPMIFSCMIAIANYAIYMATIDYMIAAYGPYSASATGGNALARDFLAGISAMYATTLYETLGLEWASTLLAFLAIIVVIPVYIFYWKGPAIRERSRFAQSLAEDRKANGGMRTDQDEKAENGTMYRRRKQMYIDLSCEWIHAHFFNGERRGT
ncbi:related to multidrug resistant protein [Ustilago bromivora]|uniref:Related to multidrug resistant protein n=1 Tax=Ustilago bromivora TaxID=307758 RepID=A0A1K0HFX7_9BASI|nr:related to multidrug resistant protein [Ustilago bromivora]